MQRTPFEPTIMEIHRKYYARDIMRVQTELRGAVVVVLHADINARREVSVMGIIILRAITVSTSTASTSLVPFTLLIESLLGYRAGLCG